MREYSLMKNKFFMRRMVIYAAGVALMSLSLALFLQSGLGFPVNSSLAYVYGMALNFKYSYSLTVMNVLVVFIQVFILKKDFERIQFLQVPMSLVLGALVELFCRVVEVIEPQSYVQQFLVLVVAIVLLGFSISIIVNTRMIPMPLEGLALAITQKLKKYPLHKVKRVTDLVIVTITIVSSLIFFGHLEGAREGTVLTALTVASIMEFFTRRLAGVYVWAGCGLKTQEKAN